MFSMSVCRLELLLAESPMYRFHQVRYKLSQDTWSMQRPITIIASFWVLLLAALGHGSAAESRFAKMFQIPGSRETVVVAEGDFEARSVGSYALRVYGGASQKSPMDDFIVGVIRPRNGTIEAVKFDTVDGDDHPEIVVIIRSAGTGGYLSADAWSYRAGLLELVLSVSDLDKAADTIRALRDKVRAPNARQPSVE
jgi:hypothetical protein